MFDFGFVIADFGLIENQALKSKINSELYNRKSKIPNLKSKIPPARLERATHSLAYLTWFPKPYLLKKNKLKVWTIS